MKVTKQVAGKPVDVPLEEVWPTIVKLVHLCRILNGSDGEKFREIRCAFIQERMDDLKNRDFHE